MGKYELQKENESLSNLKQELNTIIGDLNSAKGHVDKSKTTLNDNYKINDDKNEGVTRLDNLHTNIGNEISYIQNTVIPDIDGKISSNNAEIKRIEDEERRAREEAERKAKEEAEKKAQEKEKNNKK